MSKAEGVDGNDDSPGHGPVGEPDENEMQEADSGSAVHVLDAVGRNEKAIDRILDRVHIIVKDVGTRRASLSRLTSWLVFSFLVVIVAATGALVYVGKMADGSFTFLVGVIVGSFIQFINRLNLGGPAE